MGWSYRLTEPFVRLWRGRQSYGVAFWWYFAALGQVFARVLATVAGNIVLGAGQREAAIATYLLIALGYPTIAAVGTWRSADNFLLNNSAVPAKRYLLVFMGKAFISVGLISDFWPFVRPLIV